MFSNILFHQEMAWAEITPLKLKRQYETLERMKVLVRSTGRGYIYFQPLIGMNLAEWIEWLKARKSMPPEAYAYAGAFEQGTGN
jgi:hypothetical protein